jgi:hypothetical protein
MAHDNGRACRVQAQGLLRVRIGVRIPCGLAQLRRPVGENGRVVGYRRVDGGDSMRGLGAARRHGGVCGRCGVGGGSVTAGSTRGRVVNERATHAEGHANICGVLTALQFAPP